MQVRLGHTARIQQRYISPNLHKGLKFNEMEVITKKNTEKKHDELVVSQMSLVSAVGGGGEKIENKWEENYMYIEKYISIINRSTVVLNLWSPPLGGRQMLQRGGRARFSREK